MGIVFRQSVKTTIVTFTGAALGALVIYISTQYLPKQQFGFIRNITNQAVVFSQFILLGLHSTLYIFIHKYPPGDKRRAVLLTFCFIGPLIMSIICFIPYVFLREFIISKFQPQDVAYLRTFFLWMPLLTVFWSYLLLLEMYLTSQMKVALSIFFREIFLRICNIIFLLLYAGGFLNFYQFIIGTILTHVVPIICLLVIAYKTEGFGISFDWRVFNRKEYSAMLHFSWYHILLNVSLSMLGYIDALMLAPLDKRGMESLAVYSVAVFIMSILQIPYRSLTQAAVPVLTKAYQENDKQKVSDLFQRSAVNMLIVAVGMSVLIVCNMHNAVSVLKNGYTAITPLVLIMLIGRMADMVSGLNTEIMSISKYYKFNFYASFMLLILIFIFNRILIPKMGIYGAAWGTTLSLVIFNITKYIFVWVKLGLQPLSQKTLIVFFAGALTAAAGYFLPRITAPIPDAIFRGLFILLIYAGLLVWLKPSEDLKTYLASVKKNRRLF